MNNFRSLVKLIRFELPFSAGVCVVMGQMLAFDTFATVHLTIYGFTSVFLISSAILVMNDYFDVETDKINAPSRPIPAGLVSLNAALFFSLLLLLVGLFLSYLINITALIISLVLMIIGFLYNRYFKKSGLPGNLLVSFSVGMTFIYGGASVGSPFQTTVLFFGLIAALIDLGEEIAADAMDIKGDQLIKSNSLAIKFGKPVALKISASIFALVIFISIIPFIPNRFTPIYLLPIGIMDISIAFFAIKLLRSKNESERRFIRGIYLGSIAGILVFLIMKLFGV